MTTQIEFEQKMGALLSKKGNDIKEASWKLIDEVFIEEPEPRRSSYQKWAKEAWCDCSPKTWMKIYFLIQTAKSMKKDLNKCSKWKVLMGAVLPLEVKMQVNKLTQVPRMAMIDKTVFEKRAGVQTRALFRKS